MIGGQHNMQCETATRLGSTGAGTTASSPRICDALLKELDALIGNADNALTRVRSVNMRFFGAEPSNSDPSGKDDPDQRVTFRIAAGVDALRRKLNSIHEELSRVETL